MTPILGDYYLTQGYGFTDFARSAQGRRLYANFGGIHPGLDFGTHGKPLPVVATVAGKIVRASADGGWGNHVELLGADGWRRQYCHLSKILCKVGDVVAAGTTLGLVGSTGSSTAVHLHYGNRRWNVIRWEYRDPSADLELAPSVVVIDSRLVKGEGDPRVYFWSGKAKYHVPDWDTKVALFGPGVDDIKVYDPAVVEKLPEGPELTKIV